MENHYHKQILEQFPYNYQNIFKIIFQYPI